MANTRRPLLATVVQGEVYADFLLGEAAYWSAEVQPEYGTRLKTPQIFIQHDFKITPTLTLNLGLRYQIQHGWNEVKGNASVFDPTMTNPVTGTKGALWYEQTAANGRKASTSGSTLLLTRRPPLEPSEI